MESWNNNLIFPMVSILCATYNHESYISDTLNGFLIQETVFSYEILVHDDASTDNTMQILEKYKNRFPSLIKIIKQSENQFSKGVKPGSILRSLAKGKYIAICDGDDYWKDPYKLQKQVQYLESHPDVVVSTTWAEVQFVDDWQIDNRPSFIPHQEFQKDTSPIDLMKLDCSLPTLNLVYRNIIKAFPPEMNKTMAGDAFIISLLGQFGSSHFHVDIHPSVYRVHRNGLWSGLNREEETEEQINLYFLLYKYYKRIGNWKVAEHFYNEFNGKANFLSTLFVDKSSFKRSAREFFYNRFSFINSKLNQLATKGAVFFVYGYGAFGKYVSSMLGDSCIGFIDNDSEKYNQHNVYSVSHASKLKFDFIIISLLGRESDIKKILIESGIVKNKIITIEF